MISVLTPEDNLQIDTIYNNQFTVGKWESALPLTPYHCIMLQSWSQHSAFSHSHTSRLSQAANRAKPKRRPNNWFPVSKPPLFFTPIRLQWLSLFLSSSSISLHVRFPSSCTPSLSSFLRLFPLILLLQLSFLNWNSSLWNGKVIYFDSLGIWLAVLSGATCNVTGDMATVNILPPAMKSCFRQNQ